MQARVMFLSLYALSLSATLQAAPESIDIGTALAGDAEGFEQALQARAFSFPADHGSHPTFRNEWWYLTGQLQDQSGQHYGFQYTLFRVGLTAPNSDENTQWPRDTLWMAHAALSDSSQAQLLHEQRLAHGGAGTAGVTAAPFNAWLHNWQLSSDKQDAAFPWQLKLKNNQFDLQLNINNSKAPVLQGDRGLSAKGGAGNASFYYSYTDMQAEGTLDGKRVSGSAWLDREWSTSVLPPDVQGWDWFSLQLDDGRQLMLYQLRHASNKQNTAQTRSGSLVQKDGSSRTLSAKDIKMQAVKYWQSPTSKAEYPVEWKLNVEGIASELVVRANFAQQELHGVVNYWEGATTVSSADAHISGRGYLEMTGYTDHTR